VPREFLLMATSGSIAAFVDTSGEVTVIKEGALRKQGGKFKTWQKRQFVLTDVALEYYKLDGKKQRTGQCIGKVGLELLVAVDGNPVKLLPPIQKKPLFAVATEKRLYLLEAEDETEAYGWIDALRGALQSFHLRMDVTGGDGDSSASFASSTPRAGGSDPNHRSIRNAGGANALGHSPLERRGIMASPPSHAAPDPSFTLWHKWIVLKNCCVYVFPSRSAEDAGGRLSAARGSVAQISLPMMGSPTRGSSAVEAAGGAEGPTWERCIRLRDAMCNLNGSSLRFVPPAGEWLELFCRPGSEGEAEAKRWGDNVLQARVVSGLCVAAEADDAAGTAQHILALRSVEVSIDSPDEEERTALFRAARSGCVNAVRELLQHDASVHSRSGAHGATPLHTAAWHGHLVVARMLVAAGADPEAESDKGVSALTESLMDTRADISGKLVPNPTADYAGSPQSTTHAAAPRAVGDDTPMARLLLAAREEKRERLRVAKEKAREQQRIMQERYMMKIDTEKIAALRKFQRRSAEFQYIAPDSEVSPVALAQRWQGGRICLHCKLSVIDGDVLQTPGNLQATRPGLDVAARAELRDGDRRILLFANTSTGFEGSLSPHVAVTVRVRRACPRAAAPSSCLLLLDCHFVLRSPCSPTRPTPHLAIRHPCALQTQRSPRRASTSGSVTTKRRRT
jgi:hypothetical protein